MLRLNWEKFFVLPVNGTLSSEHYFNKCHFKELCKCSLRYKNKITQTKILIGIFCSFYGFSIVNNSYKKFSLCDFGLSAWRTTMVWLIFWDKSDINYFLNRKHGLIKKCCLDIAFNCYDNTFLSHQSFLWKM